MGNSWNSGLRGFENQTFKPGVRMLQNGHKIFDGIGGTLGAAAGVFDTKNGTAKQREGFYNREDARANGWGTQRDYNEMRRMDSQEALIMRRRQHEDFMRGVGPQSQHYAAQGTTATAPSIDSPTPNSQTTTYTLPAANGELAHPYGVEQPKIAANQVHGIQTMLSALGYDLGPTGVDNAYGPKTEAALKQLAQRAGVNFDELDYTQPGNPAVNKLMSYANGQTQQAQLGQQQAQPEAAPSQTPPAASAEPPPPSPQTQPLAPKNQAYLFHRRTTPLEKFGKSIAAAFNAENDKDKVGLYTNRANEQFMAMTGGTGVLNVPEGGMEVPIREKNGHTYTVNVPQGSYNLETFGDRVSDGIAQERAQASYVQHQPQQQQPQQQVAALHQSAQTQPHYAPAPRHDDVELGNLAAPSTFARDYNMDQGQQR